MKLQRFVNKSVFFNNETKSNKSESQKLDSSQIWLDERLRWNASEYGGLKALSGDKSEFSMYHDLWYPCLHLADLYKTFCENGSKSFFRPGASKQQDLFLNYDVELFITNAGTVKASIKVLVTTPCYFGFGDYPNDYQNCSFTLMSPYYADEWEWGLWHCWYWTFRMRFSSWGGAELANYLMWENEITDVQDFELIDLESQNYFMYLGMKIIDDFTKWVGPTNRIRKHFFPGIVPVFAVLISATTWCSKERTNLCLLKFPFHWSHVPCEKNCIWIHRYTTKRFSFIGMSGIVPDHYGLAALIFSVGFQLMNAINLAKVLPDDFNGMPTAGMNLTKRTVNCCFRNPCNVLHVWNYYSHPLENFRNLHPFLQEIEKLPRRDNRWARS